MNMKEENNQQTQQQNSQDVSINTNRIERKSLTIQPTNK